MSDGIHPIHFTYENADDYASIDCVGQYLLAAYFCNLMLLPFRSEIGKLLDFGCGAGKSSRALSPSVRPGGQIIGVDVSETLLTHARRITDSALAMSGFGAGQPSLLHLEKVSFHVIEIAGEEERLFVADGAVDAVSSTIVLQEIHSRALLSSVFREFARVCRPGARLALACVSDVITCEDFTAFTYAPFPDNATRADGVRRCQSTVSKIVWEHDRHWSCEEIAESLANAGWSQVRCSYPLAPAFLKPFPKEPARGWLDEAVKAPLLMVSAVR